MGLVAIATRFGVKGDPVNYHAIHLQLGEKIFGADTVILEKLKVARASKEVEALPPEELRPHLTKSHNPDTWAEMTAKQKSAFRVPGSEMGLRALATRFGVEGNPVSNHAIHLELGEKIFGVAKIQEHLKAQRRD